MTLTKLLLYSVLFNSTLAHANFADTYTPAHLTLAQCTGGIATNIVSIKGNCVQLPSVCPAPGRLCLAVTNNNNREALVCNPQAGVLYTFCE
jgi:hypothetical protein